jgi:alpha-maltose-1-phosphate synthase
LTRVGTGNAVGNRAVIVSQPVHQHSYETAVALQEAGLLMSFMTSIYNTQTGPLSQTIRMMPSPARRRVAALLAKRHHPELRNELVETLPWYHLSSYVLRCTGPRASEKIERWAHQRFDHAVGRALRQKAAVAVHANEGAARDTFRVAKELGLIRVLDVSNAYEYVERHRAILGQEPLPASLGLRVREERQLADYILAPSNFVIKCLIENGVSAATIVKVPYGVDVNRFKPPQVRQSDRFRVLFVGRIEPLKGFQFLLEAWRRLNLVNAELVLIGGITSAKSREILARYEGTFTYLGNIPRHHVHEWFQQADVLVLPSLAEGSALVTYEGLAAGLPVIATPNCGSLVRDGVDGFIVPVQDVDALADRLQLLYANSGMRQQMGAAGRSRVEDQYTWHHYRARIGTAYRAILSDESPTGALDRSAGATERPSSART